MSADRSFFLCMDRAKPFKEPKRNIPTKKYIVHLLNQLRRIVTGDIAGTYCTETLVEDIQLPFSHDQLVLLEKKVTKSSRSAGDRSFLKEVSVSANWSIVS